MSSKAAELVAKGSPRGAPSGWLGYQRISVLDGCDKHSYAAIELNVLMTLVVPASRSA